MIDKYLEELNSVIDVKKSKASQELQIKSSRYEKVERLPIAFCTFDDMSKERFPAYTNWPVFGYGEVYKDKEKMLLDELLPIYEGILADDDRTKVIRANYGVGIVPSIFGFEVIQKGNELPWIKPAESIDEIKKIIKKGVPEIKGVLIERVNETNQFYREKLNQYPNLKETIHIGLPDNQGPFNLAGIMLREELYLYLYSHKDVIKEFLEICTATYIKFSEEQKKLIGEPIERDYYFACTIPGGVKISEDYGMAISPDMYEEFCIPYNEQVSKKFNGITLLICEDLELKRLERIVNTKGLKGIIYWSRDFSKLEEAYNLAKHKKICIIWYGSIPKEKRRKFPTGVILKQQIRSLEEASFYR